MNNIELKIYDCIMDNPGIIAWRVHEQTHVDFQPLLHHLNEMERRGDIVVERDAVDPACYECFITVE